MRNSIPIFPLNLVIFPGSTYPLHIFEERYKLLINRCLEDEEGFGIVSTIDGSISDVGCLVYIKEVIKRYEDGKLDIVVEGLSRFQVISRKLNENGYLDADILPFDDIEESPIANIAYEEKAISKFHDILERTKIELQGAFWEKLDEAPLKSFKIAEKSGLNIQQQQNLLSFQSENERLVFLLNHFKLLEDYLDSDQVVRDIVMRDGYIN